MISVIIPTRDRSALLARALQSVLSQRGVDVHVIVVDDGSSDRTPDMLARHHDKRLSLVRHSQPLGVSNARNSGIAAASGEWVAFLDDDDLWSPTKLAEQVAAAEACGSPWACSGSVTFSEDERGVRHIVAGSPPLSSEEIAATLPVRNCIPAGASNVLVRAAALRETGGFDPVLRHMADWDLWMRLVRLGAPAVVSEPAVGYRLHEGNASTDSEVIDREIAHIESKTGSGQIDHAFIHRWTAWHLLRAGNRQAALRAYANAVRAGDVASLGRAAVALIDAGVAHRTLARHAPDAAWSARANTWLYATAF